MRRFVIKLFVGVLGCAGWLVGCAQPRAFEDLWVPPRPYHAERGAVRPPTDALDRDAMQSVTSPVTSNPTGELTLRDAVGLALAQSPALRSAGWGVVAAQADAAQHGRPPNPRIGLAVENVGGPDAGPVFERQTLRLSQVIELADKRAKRQALGEATGRLRAWDYEQARLDVAASAGSRYVAVVVAQERVALAKEQLVLAEAGYTIADERVRNEVAPGLERDQAAARVALSKIALEQARQQHAADRADLAATWGAKAARFNSVAGDLEALAQAPPLERLQARLAQSPQVARWDDEIAQRRRALELQRANAVADPTAGVGLRYFPDAEDSAGVFELSWPLTVFDDNRDGVLAARLRLAQARAQQTQAQAEASQALARAYARYQSSAYAVEALDGEALPASQSAYRAAVDAYEAGLTDYLTVLDAERTLLETRGRRLDALLAYHQSAIEIERATAQPLADPESDAR